MARYLYVVDLQKEFVKDKKGREVYKKCISYILSYYKEYHTVLACMYVNDRSNLNMERLVGYQECKSPENLEFPESWVSKHDGYSVGVYPNLNSYDTIDVIGFDTDACVLSACFDLFNIGCNLRIITDLCWSSGGKKMHEAGLTVMRRQFGKAVDEKYKYTGG